MISFNAKYFGFSLITWVVLGIVILYFSYNLWSDFKEGFTLENPTVETGNVKITCFYAEWCGYSKKFMGEDFKSGEWGTFRSYCQTRGIETSQISDTNEDAMVEYGISGFPTILIQANGQEKKLPGYRTSDQLQAIVEEFLSN